MRSWIRIAVLVMAVYLGLYVRFRSQWRETWEKDGREYVIYPADSRGAYYVFRPLGYIDAWVTGMGSHLGPHS